MAMKPTDLSAQSEQGHIQRGILAAVDAFPVYANWQQTFAESQRIMSNDPLSDGSLSRAFVLWRMFPLYMNSLTEAGQVDAIFDNIDVQSGLVSLECLLTSNHELAARALMRIAESLGVDSTTIDVAGRYCREYRWPLDLTKTITWPECMHDRLFGLPADIRNAIIVGNASVERVLAIRSLRGFTDSKNLTGIVATARPDAKDRDDTPTEADLIVGRSVLSAMGTLNPKAESFREAIRERGQGMSNKKAGLLLKMLKSERKQSAVPAVPTGTRR